jgi:hypothetical protein
MKLCCRELEMIKGDYYRKGDMVRGIIKKVEMRNNAPFIHHQPHRSFLPRKTAGSRSAGN